MLERGEGRFLVSFAKGDGSNTMMSGGGGGGGTRIMIAGPGAGEKDLAARPEGRRQALGGAGDLVAPRQGAVETPAILGEQKVDDLRRRHGRELERHVG